MIRQLRLTSCVSLSSSAVAVSAAFYNSRGQGGERGRGGEQRYRGGWDRGGRGAGERERGRGGEQRYRGGWDRGGRGTGERGTGFGQGAYFSAVAAFPALDVQIRNLQAKLSQAKQIDVQQTSSTPVVVADTPPAFRGGGRGGRGGRGGPSHEGLAPFARCTLCDVSYPADKEEHHVKGWKHQSLLRSQQTSAATIASVAAAFGASTGAAAVAAVPIPPIVDSARSSPSLSATAAPASPMGVGSLLASFDADLRGLELQLGTTVDPAVPCAPLAAATPPASSTPDTASSESPDKVQPAEPVPNELDAPTSVSALPLPDDAAGLKPLDASPASVDVDAARTLQALQLELRTLEQQKRSITGGTPQQQPVGGAAPLPTSVASPATGTAGGGQLFASATGALVGAQSSPAPLAEQAVRGPQVPSAPASAPLCPAEPLDGNSLQEFAPLPDETVGAAAAALPQTMLTGHVATVSLVAEVTSHGGEMMTDTSSGMLFAAFTARYTVPFSRANTVECQITVRCYGDVLAQFASKVVRSGDVVHVAGHLLPTAELKTGGSDVGQPFVVCALPLGGNVTVVVPIKA